MSEGQIASTENKHYDENVFPRIERGEKPFNWLAAFFGVYWFAYKGLKQDYLKLVVPIAIAQGIAEVLSLNGVLLGIWITSIILFGTESNKRYYAFVKSNNKPANSIWMGIGGLFIYWLITFSSGFLIGLAAAIFRRLQ